MLYSTVLSAVVSALGTEAADNTSKQAWQKLYIAPDRLRADRGRLSPSRLDGMDRRAVDCWIYARLQSQLITRHWNALMAKFSVHKGKKVHAIGELVPLMASHAPQLFLYKAVTAWAIPPLLGAKVIADREQQNVKRSTDMIVLPETFYDISTWDPQGLNRTTYWRWKKAIDIALEALVKDALKSAEAVLIHEGVLLSKTG
ncbi:hypothetical protein [Pseudomonas sp. LP_7_YM]|uniref:hypothetical protein n=1 Tax=Pseudomonas sp. LP_7_YM TaxID=2485137 RepID=UPI00105EA727|nr:hypothetical protein [Pseudomonas sp. LP_7_YM]TDV67565.1 hypothetical protein EC915_10399 [Pseudomonas sp. LP_7_YM]